LLGKVLKINLVNQICFLSLRVKLVVAMKPMVEGQTPSLDALWKLAVIDRELAAQGGLA
jgi:hypothetical protein